MSWVHGHVIGRVEYADGWDGWHELFASFNTSERCIVVQWSHSAVFSDEILYALVNNSCLREGVAALHDAMTDGVDVVEVVNNGEVTSGECVDNECNGLLVVVGLNILFDLFAFCLDFEAGVAAHTDAFDKALGHNVAVVHVNELELQGRTPTVHN